ncbi:hypothetical protein ABZ734_30860 [Streptomyces sp. NPDC006660]|uniref:hypothetical protein n=1 Tax=Streptomyces sp. NPDC006660 TaxID=3156901 RepID=UPI0033F8CE8C
MRIRPTTLCAAVAAATLTVLPASPAVAESEPHGSVRVTPSTTAPGGEVDLRVSVCGGREAVGSSDAFVSEARFTPADGGLVAQARIRSDAQDRDYDVWVTCKDSHGKASGRFTVVHGDRRDHDHDRDHDRDHGRPTPDHPVHAGGGGAATLASEEAKEQGPGTRHAVIGLALAAVAAVAVASRSVRRRRGGG